MLKGLAGISRAGRGEDEEDEESSVLTFVGTIEDEDAVGEAYEEALPCAGVRSASTAAESDAAAWKREVRVFGG